jgi:signal transduction histidine kinase
MAEALANEEARSLQRSVRVVALVAVAVTVVGLPSAGILNTGFVAFPVVGAIILWHRPRNAIGWLLLGIGSLPNLSALAGEWHPGVLAVAWLVRPVQKVGVLGFGLIPFLVLLFPSGSLPSARWRLPTRVAGAALGALFVMETLRPDGGHAPSDLEFVRPVVAAVFTPCVLVMVAFGVAALVHAGLRTRRAVGDEREQLRWFVASASLFPGVMFVNGLAQGQPWQGAVLVVAFTIGLAAIAIGIGVAVLKYRLYAIDVVINKALVYGSLVALVTGAYVAIVVGIGALAGSSGDTHLGLSIVATVVVALAFHPVRERLQRLANRVVYGARLSPYEAIAQLTHRVTDLVTFEDVLPEIAEATALGVGASTVQVRLFVPGGDDQVADWPTTVEPPVAASTLRHLPVVDHGAAIGEIVVGKAAGDALTPHDERLLQTIVSEAALAMRNLRLTQELQLRLVDLQESRRRLVTAQDVERRRMERDIHDGAQQQLVAMKIKLGLAKSLLHDDPDLVAQLLDDLALESTEAISTLRDLARGLFPQVLVDRGLVAAIEAHVAKSNLPAVVEVDGELGALDPQAEANIYFVIREALQNVSKYAGGASIRIGLAVADEGWLRFRVADDGPGFDLATAKRGSGSENMRDRVEALGGRFVVTSAPGQGTEVVGDVPVRTLTEV